MASTFAVIDASVYIGGKPPGIVGVSSAGLLELSALPRGAIDGFILSHAADADHDITFGAGRARSTANTKNIIHPSAITKQIDAAWAAGTNVGGLFSGTVAADTWYHCHAIHKTSDGTVDCGFDTSVTAANIPSGYGAYRRVGSVLTDSSANIIPFVQKSDGLFYWQTLRQDVDEAVGSGGITKILASVPTGVVVYPIYKHTSASGNPFAVCCTPLDLADQAPTVAYNGAFPSDKDDQGNSAGRQIAKYWLYTNTSAQIRIRTNTLAGCTLYIRGWRDPRGRDI